VVFNGIIYLLAGNFITDNGSAIISSLFSQLIFFVCFDDCFDQPMPDYIFLVQLNMGNPITSLQDIQALANPLFWFFGRSICVRSPVMIALALAPIRVRNIFNCRSVAFWASSKIINALSSVRPRMYASGAISIVRVVI